MAAVRCLLGALALLLPGVAAALGPTVSQHTLANGAVLLVSEQHNIPMLLVQVLLDAGARRDPRDRAGLANLTSDLLTEGTTTRSAAQISEAIDLIGGSLGGYAHMDYAVVALKVLRKDLDVGLDLLTDILLRPAFAAEELERRREAVLAGIRAAEDNPTAVATKAFRKELFAGEPYGDPVEGTKESVRLIGRADVRSFYERHYRPAGAAIVVVGDIDAAEARERLERALATWRGSSGPPFEYPPASAGVARTLRIDRPISQASIVLGQRGVARKNPDYEALTVMNYVLGGGGFSSRLMESIRTQAGLAYSVGSFFTVNESPGAFEIIMQTKNASAAEAIALARQQVERIRERPISEQELEDAKRYLTGSFPLRLDSNSKIAGFIGQVWIHGLGLDYADVYIRRVDAVAVQDVQRVAREYLHPDRLLEVVVADLQAANLPAATGSPTAAKP